MGYRLNIQKCTDIFGGTKLFGYCDERKLESYQYLMEKKYIDEDWVFGYGCDARIILPKDDFIEFLTFYIEDLKTYGTYTDDDIEKMGLYDIKNNANQNCDYVIHWGA